MARSAGTLLGCWMGIAAIAASNSTASVAGNSITFNKDVLPILQKHCQGCHRPRELAPMSLLSYREARPWAKAIKAAVATRKMPPWFVDAEWSAESRYGHFLNDRRLTDAEIRTLVAWADQGALEGLQKDAPPALRFQSGWNIQPDMVVELPKPVSIPATGTIHYKFILVKTRFPSDMWVEAAEMRPGNPRVLHHGKVWVRPPGSRWMEHATPGEAYEDETQPGAMGRNLAAEGNEILGKFNPGLGAQRFDIDGAAKFVPKGSDLVFELHYTAAGEPATDVSKLGLVLAKHRPVARYVYLTGPSAYDLVIRPGDRNAEVVSEATVRADVKLAYVQPHMHLRGKDYELRLISPAGVTETVFKGKFDFTWQLGYEFAQPIPVPAGTRIVGISHFDNSANNRFNPDPSKEVRWGDQNWEEMSQAFLGVVMDARMPAELVLRVSQSSLPLAGKFWPIFGLHSR